jgi:cytidyltransferase-like protein
VKVAVIPGRFQGVTTIHEKIINDASIEFDKVIVVIVDGEKSSQDKVKNPFTAFTRRILLTEVIKNLNNVNIITYKSAYLQDLLDFITVIFGLNKVNDEIIICCGSDRLNSYTNQIKGILGFRNIVVKCYLRKIKVSSTILRESIMYYDYQKFLEISPKFLHRYFFVLRSMIFPNPCTYI